MEKIASTSRLGEGGIGGTRSTSTRAQMWSYIKVEKYGQLSEPRDPVDDQNYGHCNVFLRVRVDKLLQYSNMQHKIMDT
jgi:hypothetical protein